MSNLVLSTPQYEVKFLLKADNVLEAGKLKEDFLKIFNVTTTTNMVIAYLDTEKKDMNKENWTVRVRRKEGKKTEYTFKKRYPVNIGLEETLKLAAIEGFNQNLADKYADKDYKSEVDWGIKKETLSFSYSDKVSAKKLGDLELPSLLSCISDAINVAPVEFINWGKNKWGRNNIKESKMHGPVTAVRHTGVFESVDVDIEVWEIEENSFIAEMSFKTTDMKYGQEHRAILMERLKEMDILSEEDISKTDIILNKH